MLKEKNNINKAAFKNDKSKIYWNYIMPVQFKTVVLSRKVTFIVNYLREYMEKWNEKWNEIIQRGHTWDELTIRMSKHACIQRINNVSSTRGLPFCHKQPLLLLIAFKPQAAQRTQHIVLHEAHKAHVLLTNSGKHLPLHQHRDVDQRGVIRNEDLVWCARRRNAYIRQLLFT